MTGPQESPKEIGLYDCSKRKIRCHRFFRIGILFPTCMLDFTSRHDPARRRREDCKLQNANLQLKICNLAAWELPVMDSHEDELAQSQGSTKLPFSPAQPDCLLTIGSQRFAAILTDECETGLHVQIQGSPLFWVEDSGVLQTPDSEFSVRVTNIVRIESIEDQFVSSIPAFRIGLTCLGQTKENRRRP